MRIKRPETKILELQPEELSVERVTGLVAEWERFPGLPAVEAGCVSVIDGGHVLLPGPRMPQLLSELETALDACLKAAA